METILQPNTKLTAVYGRVSSINQENEGTIETQLTAIREFAILNRLAIIKEYIDEGWSGDSLERPSLDQLRMDAKKNLWQNVLIYDPDRLARRYSYQELITDELREKGIEVLYVTTPSPKEGIEKILFGVQGLFAEYERAKIAERFRLGKVRKAKEGKIIATEAPYGYTFIPKKGKKSDPGFQDGYYKTNEQEAKVVKEIFRMVGQDHLSLRGLIRELQKQGIYPRKSKRKVWSSSTLSRLLRNKTYIGEAHFGATTAIIPKRPLKIVEYKKNKKSSRRIKPESEWIKIPAPRLIDTDLFNLVQKQLKANFELCGRNKKNNYLLAGKIWCTCGRRRIGEGAKNGKYLYYRCTDRVCSFPLQPTCFEKGVNARLTDNALWQNIFNIMTEPTLLHKMINEWVESKKLTMKEFVVDTESINAEIKKLKQQEDRYINAYGMGVLSIDQFQKHCFPIKEEKENLLNELAKSQEAKSSDLLTDLPTGDDIERFSAHISKQVNLIDFETKEQIIEKVIKKVTISNGNLSIKGAIPLSLYSENVSLCLNYRYGASTIRPPNLEPYIIGIENFPDGLNTIRLPEFEHYIPFEFEIELPPMYQRVPKDYDKIYCEFHKVA